MTFRTPRNGTGKPRRARVCIGGACIDKYLLVKELQVHAKNRLTGREEGSGGGAGNVAVGHARLAPDRHIVLVAATGDDAEGRWLRQSMAERGIELPCPPVGSSATSVSYIITPTESGASTILTEPGAREAPLSLELVERALPGAEACCLVAPPRNEQIGPILGLAARYGVPVFFGLGSTQVYRMPYRELNDALSVPVELVICNRKEAGGLTHCDDLDEQMEALTFGGSVRIAVITHGPEGIDALCDGQRYHVPAYRDGRPVVDDVGAGDAAQAAIVDALLRGYPLEAALLAGARQGFEACTAYGATAHLLDAAAMRDFLSLAVAGVG